MLSSLVLWLKELRRKMPKKKRCPRRCGHISFTDGENLYVWGGHNKEGRSETIFPNPDEIWIYHTKFDSWSVRKCRGEYHAGASGACCGVVFPYLYVYCGHSLGFGASNAMTRLNLTTFEWDSVTVMGPEVSPRDKAACWVYKDKLYCFGGYGPHPDATGLDPFRQGEFVIDQGTDYLVGWNSQLLIYDPVENEWSSPKPKNPSTVPLPRAAHAAVLMKDEVFLFGGRHRQSRMNDLHCLDLPSLTWGGRIQTNGPEPKGRSWHSLCRLDDDRFFLYGGFSQTQDVFDDAWIYTVSEHRWTELVHHNGHPRGWHTAVVTNCQDVLVFGGFTKDILDLNFDFTGVSDRIVKFQFQPLTLKDQCLQAVFREVAPQAWVQLPKSLQDWLQTKRRLDRDSTPSSPDVSQERGTHTISGFPT